MQIKIGGLLLLVLPWCFGAAQNAVPTFQHTIGQESFTLLGGDPARGGVTSVPTVLVPIALSFDTKKSHGKPFVMDAASGIPHIVSSPIFSKFAFPSAGAATQYADALLRSTFSNAAEGWHTMLAQPEIKRVKIAVPAGYGYVLTSKKEGRSFAVVDIEFLQKELFKQVAAQPGKLVVAVTQNTAYYTEGDATLCCSWGTHGVDSATGNSFVLASYLDRAPSIVEDRDVQPLTQQLGEFVNDPLHDPLLHGRNPKGPGNTFPAWMRPAGMRPGDQGSCGGTGVASAYFLLEPTNTNRKNNLPSSQAFVARANGAEYHVQNVALLPWYTGASDGVGSTFSFPDAQALTEAAKPCPARGRRAGGGSPAGEPTAAPVANNASANGHELIGYWVGYGAAGSALPLREVSPQWDVIIVAFADVNHQAPEGTMRLHVGPMAAWPGQPQIDLEQT